MDAPVLRIVVITKKNEAAGKIDAAVAYYCVAAKLVCWLAGNNCWANCVRQSLQELDTELNCINRPTSELFTACEENIHAAAFSLCYGIC